MKRRLTAALAAVTLAGSAIIANAALASAYTGSGRCNPSGDLGTVCIAPASNGYDAWYWNTTNHATYVDFNLWTSTGSLGQIFGDKGAFTTQPGDGKHTYFFAVGDHGCGDVVLYDRTGALQPQWSGWSCTP
jgi:hypothetical protein